MKKLYLVVSVLLMALAAFPAAADPGHERPKITRFEFLQPPLKAGINETLKVVAHDPNSWISEVQVQYEDANGDGGVTFAHTYCVQDPDFSDPGTPAKLKIPILFEKPGSYHVQVRAISSIKCAGDDTSRNSKTLERDVVVTEALETASDPDDTSGPFDVSTLEQTQESSETSATTEIVHRIRTFEPWSNDALGGAARVEIWFDLDNDPAAFERVLTVDLDERDSQIRASMLNQMTGQARGYAAVFRPDDQTLELRFPPNLLKEGIHEYQWYALLDGGENAPCSFDTPCIDQAPDSNLLRHRL